MSRIRTLRVEKYSYKTISVATLDNHPTYKYVENFFGLLVNANTPVCLACKSLISAFPYHILELVKQDILRKHTVHILSTMNSMQVGWNSSRATMNQKLLFQQPKKSQATTESWFQVIAQVHKFPFSVL